MMDVMALYKVLCNNVAVEQVNYPSRILSIGWRVRNHDDRCARFVHLSQQIHYFLAMR